MSGHIRERGEHEKNKEWAGARSVMEARGPILVWKHGDDKAESRAEEPSNAKKSELNPACHRGLLKEYGRSIMKMVW